MVAKVSSWIFEFCHNLSFLVLSHFFLVLSYFKEKEEKNSDIIFLVTTVTPVTTVTSVTTVTTVTTVSTVSIVTTVAYAKR